MKLLDLFVEFSTKGIGDVKDAMASVRDEADKVSSTVKTVGVAASTSFVAAAAGSDVLKSSYVTTGGNAVTTFVAQGVAAASLGQKLVSAGKAALAMGAAVQTGSQLGGIQAKILAENIDKVNLELFAAQSAARGLGGECVESMDKALEKIKMLRQQLTFLTKEEKESGEKGEKGANAFSKALEKASQTAKWAFLGITGAIGGFVTAGLSGTGAGAMLSFQMGQLSRTIAGLVGPEIRQLTQWIGGLTRWINSLTDAQKDNIVYWGKIGIGILGIVAIAPVVVGALGMMAKAWALVGVSTLVAAGAAAIAERNWAKLALVVAVAAAGVGGAAFAIKKINDALTPAGATGGRGQLGLSNGPISSIQDTYKRIQESATDSIPAKQLSEAEKHTKLLEEFKAIWGNQRPALVR